MKRVVDLTRCQGYAQRAFLAPSAFTMRGDEALLYDPNPSDELRGRVLRAELASVCRELGLAVPVAEAGPAPLVSALGGVVGAAAANMTPRRRVRPRHPHAAHGRHHPSQRTPGGALRPRDRTRRRDTKTRGSQRSRRGRHTPEDLTPGDARLVAPRPPAALGRPVMRRGATSAAVPRGHGRSRGAAMTAAPSWGDRRARTTAIRKVNSCCSSAPTFSSTPTWSRTST